MRRCGGEPGGGPSPAGDHAGALILGFSVSRTMSNNSTESVVSCYSSPNGLRGLLLRSWGAAVQIPKNVEVALELGNGQRPEVHA